MVKGRQSREHLFKWKAEIHSLWELLWRDRDTDKKERRFKGRKGFGYVIRKTKVIPSNVSIKSLLGNESFSKAILESPKKTRAEIINDGSP